MIINHITHLIALCPDVVLAISSDLVQWQTELVFIVSRFENTDALVETVPKLLVSVGFSDDLAEMFSEKIDHPVSDLESPIDV